MNDIDPFILIIALFGVTLWHELGHLAAARWLGVPIVNLYIGLGPVLWRRTSHQAPEFGPARIAAGHVSRNSQSPFDGWAASPSLLTGSLDRSRWPLCQFSTDLADLCHCTLGADAL